MTFNDQVKKSDTTLLLGATGATGSLVLTQLLAKNRQIKIIVRDINRLPSQIIENELVEVIQGDLLGFSDTELQQYLLGCTAVVSCLGHNLTLKGIYGYPRRLVTESAERIVEAVKQNDPSKPVKYVLMNSNGYRNRDTDQAISFMQKCVIGLIRILLPPHADNEHAAEFFRLKVGLKNASIHWVVVRPSGLNNDPVISQYSLHPAPTRSAIFEDGSVSRINVGHFISGLITNQVLWKEWKGKMPVIYNLEAQSEEKIAA